MHLNETAEVDSHCVTFSLSDVIQTSGMACSHQHDKTCDQCLALDQTLQDIERRSKDCNFDAKDEAVYTIQSAMLAIQSWKCHILRSWSQDQARFDILDIVDEQTILIVNDWAMKFLPQKYRESQSDWFGKRGILWHISVVHR